MVIGSASLNEQESGIDRCLVELGRTLLHRTWTFTHETYIHARDRIRLVNKCTRSACPWQMCTVIILYTVGNQSWRIEQGRRRNYLSIVSVPLSIGRFSSGVRCRIDSTRLPPRKGHLHHQ